MARVSLIVHLAPGTDGLADRVEGICRSLEFVENGIEVIGVRDPRRPDLPRGWNGAWKSVVAERPGLAAAGATGMDVAVGEVLVVLDPGRGYTAGDIGRVIEPVLHDDADLAVASWRAADASGSVQGRGPRWLPALARRLIGSTDPFSGLVALSRRHCRPVVPPPVGSMLALDLLATSRGRRVDVPVDPGSILPRARFGLDDLRCAKRLADNRFGTFSRLIQFCMVGASGMVVDLLSYALFQRVFSGTGLASMTTPLVGGPLGLAAAGTLAIALALTWNFLLNRRLTFNDAREGSLVHQYLAYALSNMLGIALSLSLRLMLPNHVAFFQRHNLAAAVVGIATATGITFSMARWFVFGRPGGTGGSTRDARSTRVNPLESPVREVSHGPHSRKARRAYSSSRRFR